MAVRITDPDTFNRAVEVLLRLGGTFETWGVGVLVVTPYQKAVLEKAGIVSETEEKSRATGKAKPQGAAKKTSRSRRKHASIASTKRGRRS